MRRLWAVAGLVLALLVVTVSEVRAGDTWCFTDPPLQIRTPGENKVLVFVTNGALGTEHQAALQAATVGYTAQPVDGGSHTAVVVTVLIPDDAYGSHYPVVSTVSSGPWGGGTVYARASGYSGMPLLLGFTLDVP